MFRFPWGDMHSLNLGWFLQKFNELREDWATAEAGIDGALDAEIQKAEDALSDVFDARDAAAASATAAAGSASAAGTSATAAQNSATAAASSATLANQKATAAGLSEAAAAQSATQAGNSATAAAGSATTASTAATNAAASETAAGQSATAAAGSATAAATSETNAAASAARAEEVEQSIPEDYSTLSNNVTALETEVDDLSNLIGVDSVTENTFNTTTSTLDVTQSRTLVAGQAGDELTAEITSTSQTGTAYLYLDNADNTETYISGGNLPFTITRQLSKDIIAAKTYARDLTPPCAVTFKITLKRNRITRTQEIIAKTLESMTADTALVANDFRIVNNTLYQITAPIASGGTLTPGTNCTATTIAAVLKTMLS